MTAQTLTLVHDRSSQADPEPSNLLPAIPTALICDNALLLERLRRQYRERRQPFIQGLGQLTERARHQARSQPAAPSDRTLSAPEASILRSVMEGAPTNQIAMGLGLPETAVKDHIKSMLRKALSTTPPLKLVCRAEEAE